MKHVFKHLGTYRWLYAIAIVAIIGFTGCSTDSGGPGDGPGGGPGGGPIVGSGQFAGKDVLGNSYKLSVGSSSSRSALVGDRYTMEITTRDGKTRYVTGTVTGISEDGTLMLKPDGANTDEFTAVVEGNSLDSVVGEDIPFIGTGGAADMDITPRTFDTVYLRANRWDNSDNPEEEINAYGENWTSATSVLVTDFPSNVSKLEQNNTGRYTITISGTSDVAIDFGTVSIQGITKDGNWHWLTGTFEVATDYMKVPAGMPFEKVLPLKVWGDHNLMDYKEVVLEFVNELKYDQYDANEYDRNNGTIPSDIENGDIMATISNLKIVLRDTLKDKLGGNMGDYHYGYQEDGLSIEYRQAVWSLDAENVALAKVPGAKFEFFVTDTGILDEGIENYAPVIAFIWQDPARGLWWQNETQIAGKVEAKGWDFEFADGVTWDGYRSKISVDIATLAKDPQFASATELNFIVAYWWDDKKQKDADTVDDLGIAGGNIVEAPPNNPGNLGNYTYGSESVQYKEERKADPNAPFLGYDDYYLVAYNKIQWALSNEVQTIAQAPNATLVIEFEQPLVDNTVLVLAWFDSANDRWWPTADEEGTESANLFVYNAAGVQNGATYDTATKTLTMPLSRIETYDGFKDAVALGLQMECWWLGTKDGMLEVNFNHDLRIKSANIILGGGVQESLGTTMGFNWETNKNKDDTVSSVAGSMTANSITMSGTRAEGDENYAQIIGAPNADTLAAMKTMTKLTFKASGDGKQYEVSLPTVESNVAYNHFRYTFTAGATPETVTINIPTDLAQADWGGYGVVEFVQNNITGIQFELAARGTFDLTISDLKLVP